MKFWQTIKSELGAGENIVLLYVIESKGSSPGRQGFKMMVSTSGIIDGSIGGGIMEHKLVELCKSELAKKPFFPFLKRQIHQNNIPQDKSGMICSGEQTIAFYHLKSENLQAIEAIIKAIYTKEELLIAYSENGFELIKGKSQLSKFILTTTSPTQWKLVEDIHFAPQLHIIGGGHVSLALSKFAQEVGFNVTVYDDRSNLNTMYHNQFATTQHIEKYSSIPNYILDKANAYVVIMSFGYKTDKIILRSLLKGNYKYLGLMGSQAKIEVLFSEFIKEGMSTNHLNNIYAPIGFSIASKTPKEIAISILCELIYIKNKE